MIRRILLGLAILALGASPAYAHLSPGEHGSFAAGFSHPLFGADHIMAMVAVGLWGGLIGGSAVWKTPAAFVAAMVGGFALAAFGVSPPYVEPTILASVVALGLVVALAVKPPLWAAALFVAGFAVMHGHAHGGEMGEASALPYGAGFVFATALLHGVGIGAATLIRRPAVVRAFGALTAAAGLYLVFA